MRKGRARGNPTCYPTCYPTHTDAARGATMSLACRSDHVAFNSDLVDRACEQRPRRFSFAATSSGVLWSDFIASVSRRPLRLRFAATSSLALRGDLVAFASKRPRRYSVLQRLVRFCLLATSSLTLRSDLIACTSQRPRRVCFASSSTATAPRVWKGRRPLRWPL